MAVRLSPLLARGSFRLAAQWTGLLLTATPDIFRTAGEHADVKNRSENILDVIENLGCALWRRSCKIGIGRADVNGLPLPSHTTGHAGPHPAVRSSMTKVILV
jgi:hypothetical protein